MDPVKKLLVHPDDKDRFSLFSVSIMEHLWWIPKQLMHKDQVRNVETSLAWIESRYKELYVAFEDHEREGLDRRRDAIWSKPGTGVLKLNTDAVMANRGSVLAIFARNDK